MPPPRMNPAQLAAWMGETMREFGVGTVDDVLALFCGTGGALH